MSLIDPITLPTYTARLTVEDDRSWLEESFAGSDLVVNNAIFPVPDPTSDHFLISAMWSVGENRVLWTMNAYWRGSGTVLGGAIAIHPDFRGQGHHQQYVKEIFAYIKENPSLHDDFTTYIEEVLPYAAGAPVPGATAKHTSRGLIHRSGRLLGDWE